MEIYKCQPVEYRHSSPSTGKAIKEMTTQLKTKYNIQADKFRKERLPVIGFTGGTV